MRAQVNVIHGCNERCTYCVVPNTRGVEQSRAPEAIRVGHFSSQGWMQGQDMPSSSSPSLLENWSLTACIFWVPCGAQLAHSFGLYVKSLRPEMCGGTCSVLAQAGRGAL